MRDPSSTKETTVPRDGGRSSTPEARTFLLDHEARRVLLSLSSSLESRKEQHRSGGMKIQNSFSKEGRRRRENKREAERETREPKEKLVSRASVHSHVATSQNAHPSIDTYHPSSILEKSILSTLASVDSILLVGLSNGLVGGVRREGCDLGGDGFLKVHLSGVKSCERRGKRVDLDVDVLWKERRD